VPITWQRVAEIAGIPGDQRQAAGPGADARPAAEPDGRRGGAAGGAAGAVAVGRPHIAQALIEAGLVGSIGEAFTPEWIGPGGAAYVEKHELDPFEAVRLVKNAGGITVFAHPAAVKRGRCVPDSVIHDLAAAGLDGIEVDHMDHDEPTRAKLRRIAAELGLLVTGSSDYHGARKTCRLGEYTTDPDVYREIVRRAAGAAPITAS
jgi:predicted metal-dependent phosphoesterase TrpH